jgi:hypothetical protein
MQPRAGRTTQYFIFVLGYILLGIQPMLDVLGGHWTFENGGEAHDSNNGQFAEPFHDLAQKSVFLTQIASRAEERIAYLFLHLIGRIEVRRVIREGRYPFPLRQQHIADGVGLTTVRVSRVLSDFRERAIMALSEGVLEILDFPELERMGSL